MGIPGETSGSGDARTRWNVPHARSDDALVTAAVRESERILAQKRSRDASASRAEEDKPSERIKRFDPHAGRRMLVIGVGGG